MRDNNKHLQEINTAETTLEIFAEYYNKNIPGSFPRATAKALEQFQATHIALFTENKLWTIDKHRRRLMDWLPSYREAV